MATEATERSPHLGLVGRVHYIRDRMVFDRMSEAKAQRQNCDLVLLVVIVGQLT